MPHTFLEGKMNIWNDFDDDGRRLSGKARAAIFLLAAVALAGAGGLGLYLTRPPAEPESMAAPAPKPAPARAATPADPGTVAAARPSAGAPSLAAPKDDALRDEQYKDAVADAPRVAAGEHLKDAVGDFRLLKPGGDKVPNTVIGKSGPKERYYGWAGPYVGVNLGGAVGTSAVRTSVGSGPDYFLSPDIAQIGDLGSRNLSPTGVIGGAQAGYNCQHDVWVLGLEADVNALQLSQTETQTEAYNSSPANTFSLKQSIRTDWLATIRPRAGIVLNKLLLFGTAGAALTKFKYDEEFADTFSPARATQSQSETRLGWTVGGGAEYALKRHWSVKAEYLYADFGKISSTSMLTAPAGKTDAFDHSATFNVHIVRLGLNYRF
jgi:opacity protein-like surface antigen